MIRSCWNLELFRASCIDDVPSQATNMDTDARNAAARIVRDARMHRWATCSLLPLLMMRRRRSESRRNTHIVSSRHLQEPLALQRLAVEWRQAWRFAAQHGPSIHRRVNRRPARKKACKHTLHHDVSHSRRSGCLMDPLSVSIFHNNGTQYSCMQHIQ